MAPVSLFHFSEMRFSRKSTITKKDPSAKVTSMAKNPTTQHSTICPKCGGQIPYILRRHGQPQAGIFKVPCSQHPGGNIKPTPATLAQVAQDGPCMLIHTFKITETPNSTEEIWDAPCFTTSYRIASNSPLLLESMYHDLQYVRIHPGTQRATLHYLLVILSRPWCLVEIVLSYSGILESIFETLDQFVDRIDSGPILMAHQVAEALTNHELDMGAVIGQLHKFIKQAKLVSFEDNWWRLVLAHLTRIRPSQSSNQPFPSDQLTLAAFPNIERYTPHNSVVYEPF